jgi:exopolyphosphatase/guanosine-5'-triphosphate,3'-diphosphate pyrophosphatase
MRLAAIDIGSNAVRLLVADVSMRDGAQRTEKITLTRLPIRLGEDVFSAGVVSEEKVGKLVLVMQAFAHLMEALEVEHFKICATSAMREAENADQIVERVQKKTGLLIDVIDGKREAKLIFRNFGVSLLDPRRSYLYIDVGGGSTELSWIQGAKREHSKSFKVGAVRALQGEVQDKVWDKIEAFLKMRPAGSIIAIGTGGNINRMARLAAAKRHAPISLSKLASVHANIASHSYEQRLTLLGMKPDRADVIVPAGEIYLRIMKMAGVDQIIVPKVGLADGMLIELSASI